MARSLSFGVNWESFFAVAIMAVMALYIIRRYGRPSAANLARIPIIGPVLAAVVQTV